MSRNIVTQREERAKDRQANKLTLRPCPFCGGTEIEFNSYSLFEDPDTYFQCIECSTTGPNGADRESATIQWNTRSEPDTVTLPSEVVRSLKDALEKAARVYCSDTSIFWLSQDAMSALALLESHLPKESK